MGCKYCNEHAQSDLVVRTGVVDGRLETITICTSCLWEKVLSPKVEDGNLLSEKESIESRLLGESQSAHSRMGKKVG